MSRARAYKQATLDIQQRFFDVMQELADEKRLPGGIAGYCEMYDVDRRHYYAQKNDIGKGYFEVSWLLPLIKYFRVSSNWLLFGTGKKFKGTAKAE